MLSKPVYKQPEAKRLVQGKEEISVNHYRVRYLLVALGALLGLLVVTACGSSGSSQQGASGPVELTVWHYWDAKNAEVFNELVDRYQKDHPDVRIRTVSVPGGELLTKLQAAARSNTLPSVAITDLVWVPQLAPSGRLVDLKPYAERANLPLDDFYAPALSFGKQGDEQISLPVSTNNLALMYNRDVFREAGLNPDAPPKTWEQVLEMSERIRREASVPGYELYTQTGDTGEGVTWNFMVNLWQARGEFLNEDNTAAAFNSEAGREALRFWVELVETKASPLGPWGEFEKGRAAMAQEGSWMVGLWDQDPPFDFGTAELPIPEGGRQATNLGGEQAMVFKSDEATQQAAAGFIFWFTSPKIVNEWSQQTGFLPVRRSVAESAEYERWVNENAPRLKPFIAQMPDALARPDTPLYPKVSLAFAKQVEQALNGKKSVEQALADAERDVNAILESGE
jgi:multiple sugar transport system substrate-binding protein